MAASRSGCGSGGSVGGVAVMRVMGRATRGAIPQACDVGHRQSLAVCHTLFTLSPVLSPGFASFAHVYSGLPLYAHCLPPSSRVTTVQSPDGLGVGGGHQRRPVGRARAVAGALAAGVLVERVSVMPLASVQVPSAAFLAGAVCAPAASGDGQQRGRQRTAASCSMCRSPW